MTVSSISDQVTDQVKCPKEISKGANTIAAADERIVSKQEVSVF